MSLLNQSILFSSVIFIMLLVMPYFSVKMRKVMNLIVGLMSLVFLGIIPMILGLLVAGVMVGFYGPEKFSINYREYQMEIRKRK